MLKHKVPSGEETFFKSAAIPRDPTSMPYVQVAPGGRYFITETGEPFLIIGHNEGMPWPFMRNMHHEQDIATTENYIKMLAEHGVTVIRIMLEYCQGKDWYFEKPLGNFLPEAVLYWDDLIGLCERYKIRLLVTFWDTFFMSRRWKYHPYSKKGTGFQGPGCMCTNPTAMEHQKRRISFFIERWGNSPAIFAYDLFNEIHPHWGGTPEEQAIWLTELASFIKRREMERWGKRHLLTVSIFGSKPEGGYIDLVFNHPEIDFTTTHVYEFGVVDNPDNTVDGALTMRDAVRYAYDNMKHLRPYIDSESGPIHAFMDLGKQLRDEFDDEYYHNMSWAHLATGGAGSGMRWPFRLPHTLSPGMHGVQLAMSRFLTTLEWAHFSPRPAADRLQVVQRDTEDGAMPVIPFGCCDTHGGQAIVWLLRDKRVVRANRRLAPADLLMRKPFLGGGDYVAEFWDTYAGEKTGECRLTVSDGSGEDAVRLSLPPIGWDMALAIKPLGSPAVHTGGSKRR